MNAKSLSILAIITVIVIIAAIITQKETTTTTIDKNTKLFPHLMSALKSITEIEIQTHNETMTMRRNEEGVWYLKEKHDYPIRPDKVHKLLISTADLTLLEAKTKNPDLYSKLELEEVTQEGAQSSQLIFKNKAGQTLASFIVGKERTAKTDTTLQEIYVRKVDNKQAWLVRGQLSLEKKSVNWLEDEVVNIDNKRVRQIHIVHPDGDELRVFKETPEDKNYQLADLPENAQLKFPYVLGEMASTLSHLDMNDVTTASEVGFEKESSTQVEWTTFDGLKITMWIMPKDNQYYAQFSTVYDPEAVWVEPPKPEGQKEEEKESTEEENEEDPDKPVSESEDQPKEDPKQQAERLNTQLGDWVYEFSEYKVDQLLKKYKDMIEEKSEKTESSEETQHDSILNESIFDELGTPET